MKKILNKIFSIVLNIIFSNKKDALRTVFLDGRIQLVWISEIVGRRIALRMFEKEETVFFKKNIKEGDICLDVGSNVGYFTNLFALLTGSKGKVISLEAFSRNAELIKLNTTINKTQSIIDVHCVAIGEIDGKPVSFNTTNDSSYGFIHGDDDRDIGFYGVEENVATLPMTTKKIDTLLTNSQVNRVDIMKMDIEGYEYHAFTGMSTYLSSPDTSPRIIMVELWDSLLMNYGKKVIDVITLMQKYGYVAKVLVGKKLIPYDKIHGISNVFFVK